MNNVTKKWVLMRVSSVVLIPLMTWFILNLVSVFNKDFVDIVNFFSNQPSKILVSLLKTETKFKINHVINGINTTELTLINSHFLVTLFMLNKLLSN